MSNENPHDAQRISRSPGHLPDADDTTSPAGYAHGCTVLKGYLATMPETPGVYRMLSAKSAVLYVGKAKNLKKRVFSYTQRERLPIRLQRMVALTTTMELVVTHTETEALLLEANLIRQYQPPFNILLRDDKSYPYLLIARDHPFPQLVKYRGSKDRPGWYFGPFASTQAVNETLGIVTRAFRLRTCSDSVFAHRTRPCLQYHIKRCSGPCVKRIGAEAYAQDVADVRAFLGGRDDALLADLQKKMQEASAAQDYEYATQIRDRIRLLSSIHAKQTINLAGLGDADVIALHREGNTSCFQVFFFRNDRNYGTRTFFPRHDAGVEDAALFASFLTQFYADKPVPKQLLLSHAVAEEDLIREAFSAREKTHITFLYPERGDKKRLIDMALNNAREALARHLSDKENQSVLLDGVAKIFGLSLPPQRIEIFDNSHISGQHALGAMVVAGPDGFIKKAYRTFNIKNEALKGDDYGMMREVLQRRFSRALREEGSPLPDLLLIDGGQGQLTAALETLAALDLSAIPTVGIAKGPERNAGRERFFMADREPFMLEPRDPVLYYLQRLRDEAHRFAIGSHRARRTRTITASPLDAIEGIGPTRKKKLLLHFGSAQGVARAGLEDLKRVPGISEDLARVIYGFFNGGTR